jgi:protocatechuate 3,4-dioxygenase beta subunit
MVASPRASKTTTSDAEGRFQFTALAPGEYRLYADKAGFLTKVHGASRPGSSQSGAPIKLVAGQKIDNIKLILPRGSVITGVITDEFGDPAYRVPVRAMRFGYDNGRKSLQTGTGSDTTDDKGIYRIAGLLPGEYLVSAVPTDTVSQATAQAEAVRDRLSQINASLSPNERISAPAVNPVGYVATYYPGTPMGGSAAPVRVGPGEEAGGIDIRLQSIATASISGQVTSAEGVVPQTRLQLIDASMPINGVGIWFRDMRSDGSFSFSGLVPGQYILRGYGTPGGQPGMAGGSMWGSVDVTADPRGTSGVTLRMQGGVTVSGALSLSPLPESTDVSRLRVGLVPVMSASDWELPVMTATPDAAGRFTFEKVVPGSYRPRVTGVPETWAIASAVFDEKDAADLNLVIDGSRNIAGGAWKMSGSMAEVTGTITLSTGAPAPDHTILIFPADSRLWVPQSRRILVTRPGADGRYTLRGLPPGEYRIAPLVDPDPGQWFIPDFLAQTLAIAVSLTLGEGERRAQDLRVR